MKQIFLVFTRKALLVSWFVRAITRRPGLDTSNGWSHVGVVVGANFDHVVDSYAGKGVRLRTLKSLVAGLSPWDVTYVPVNVPRDDEGFIIGQVCKVYDYSALWAFLVPSWVPWRRNWQRTDCWFCSELAAQHLLLNGYEGTPRDARFITPNYLYEITSKKAL